ncbi:MAG: DMT family transporter [Armatimonadota bacterium]|nr:DMT family transporter [Armatimonadota bacterium]MDR5702046.1 DMT family transporter [Armatimonadota bacterium]MDR7434571.1 DMT family transporter [Armatimonadota bacterium]
MWGELFALLAAIAFALSTVLSRVFMVGGPARPPVLPEVGVLASMMTNVLAFTMLASVELAQGAARQLTPGSALLFMIGGICGTLIGRNLAYISVLRIGPSRSTAVRLSNTLFAALFGLLWLRELPRPSQAVGAVLITVGLWMVLQNRQGEEGHSVDVRGVIAALGAALAFAFGDSARRVALGVTPFPMVGASIGATTALCAQVFWLRSRGLRAYLLRFSWRSDVLGSALFNTLAILLLFLALQRAPVANVAVLYNLQVLLVITLSRWILRGDEQIGIRLLLGSVVCVAGTLGVLLG